jgi:protein TonB
MGIPVRFIRYLPYVIGLLLTIALVYVAIQFLGSVDDEPQRKRVVQQVTLIAPPPPPPPPPEQEPEVQQPEQQDVVEQQDDAMPDEGNDEDIGNELGLDADGSAGGDGFGLIARKGGRGIVGAGYGSLVVQEINALLVDDERLRHKEYTVVLQLWIGASGDIERYRIDKKSGDDAVDGLIRNALARLGSISEGPPLELPQPIRLRIKSRI